MSGGRYWVKRLDELPLVPTDDPNDFDWYPVQHHLGLGAFGVNGFGGDTATMLVAEHDESGSGQEELYVVVEGTVRFAIAVEDSTLLLAIGAPVGSGFHTTWKPEHFEQVPRAD